MDENINSKIIDKIDSLPEDDHIKDFLKKLLYEEHSGLIDYSYKDIYKEIITSFINKNDN